MRVGDFIRQLLLSLELRLMFGVRALLAASPSLRRVLVSQSAANRLFATASQTPKFSWEAGLTDNFSTKLASKAAQGVFSKQLDALAADGFEHDPFNVHQVRAAPVLRLSFVLTRFRTTCSCSSNTSGS